MACAARMEVKRNDGRSQDGLPASEQKRGGL